MSWYQFIVPVIAISLLVRAEAKFVGPYWSWLELIPLMGDEGSSTGKKRRAALCRRVAIPGIVTFILGIAWSSIYSFVDAVIVAVSGAGMLLWPLIFSSLPYGVAARRLVILYSALVVIFGATGWIGRYIAAFAIADEGVWKFLEENFVSLIVGGVVAAFAFGVFDTASSRASQDESDD